MSIVKSHHPVEAVAVEYNLSSAGMLRNWIRSYKKQPKSKYHSYKGNMNGTVQNLLLTKVVDEGQHKTYYWRSFHATTYNEI